jgi:molybdopterin-guanine dinucleotide biosynthesis protein A
MMGTGAITGFVLAGGASSRMGRDKALLPVGGRPMLLHMAAILSPYVREVVVISNNDLHHGHGLRVIADIMPGCGPVGGIATALAHTLTDLNLIISCDMPWMRGEVLERLINLSHWNLIIHGATTGRTHPLPGIYHQHLTSEFMKATLANEVRLTALNAKLGATSVHFPDTDTDAFGNMNTPDRYNEFDHAHHHSLFRHVG